MASTTKQFYSTDYTGLLSNLTTTNKSTFVGAINELDNWRKGSIAAFYYNTSPIQVTHNGSSSTVTIPTGGKIFTAYGAYTDPASSPTVLTTNVGNWISFDRYANEWILGSHVNGHEVYVIGFVSPSTYSSVLNAITDENIPAMSSHDWGYAHFAGTNGPKVRYSSSGCTLTIPDCRIVYSGIAFDAHGGTLTFTSAGWLSYDLTSEQFVIGANSSGHPLVVLGVINPWKHELSWFSGATIEVTKTIAFMGDSFVTGVGTSKVFHQYIHDRYGFTCLNFGYGGSGYARSNDADEATCGFGNEGRGTQTSAATKITPNTVASMLSWMHIQHSNDIDGIFILAGVNDWSYHTTVSVSDFIQGIDDALDYCQTYYPGVPVLVGTPVHREYDTIPKSATGKTLADYADIIIQECRKYGVPCIDLFGMSGLHPDNAENKTKYYTFDVTGGSDGLHANHFAHERIMRCIGETLNAMVKYEDPVTR